MATYVNNLRLKEITTGAESGTWGTSTNTNLELIADAFGSGTEAITTNADTHTTTIADGSADEGRAIYMKYTGTLDSACTITLAPNTINKFWIIENATSGSQNIIISQGSGANITIGNGNVSAIFTDGAGSGAAVLDALADLELSSTLTVAGASTLTGAVTMSGDASVGDDLTLVSDAAVLNFGVNSDVSLTHVHNTGLLLNSTRQLQFNDSSQFINAPSATVLDINATDEIELNATAIDLNGTLDVSGTTTLAGTLAVTGTSVFTGNVGIGGAVHASAALRAIGTQTGVSTYGFLWDGLFSGATTLGIGLGVTLATAASSFTMTNGYGVRIQIPSIGSGSAITTLYGLKIENQTGGGTNYAIHTGTGAVVLGDTLAVTGNVGIGTTGPGSNLHIQGSSDQTLQVESTGNAKGILVLDGDRSGAGSSVGQIRFQWNNNRVAEISCLSGADTTNKDEGELGFFTAPAGGTIAERVRIDLDGNVGIGTTSPRAKFDFGSGSGDGTLSQTVSEYQAVFESPQGTGDYGRNIAFAVTTNGIAAAINAVDEGGSSATGLVIATGTAGSITEALRIDSSQNTIIPATKKLYLDGGGNTYITEGAADRMDFYAGGNIRLQINAGSVEVSAGYDLRIGPTDKLFLDAGSNTYITESSADVIKLFTGGTAGLTLSAAQDVTIAGDLIVSGTGPHAIGGNATNRYQIRIPGSFTSGGNNNNAAILVLDGSLTGATGDTLYQTGARFDTSITTQGQTETVTDVAQMMLLEPSITVGSGDTVTNATTLKIVNAPTEGTNNYALWVDSGATRLDGTLAVASTSAFTGNVGIGQAAGGGALAVRETTSATTSFVLTNSHASAPLGMKIDYSTDDPNGTGNLFLTCTDSSATRLDIRSNGGIANFQSYDIDLSDERMKVIHNPTESKWDAHAALEVIDYHYTESPDTRLLIGVGASQAGECDERLCATDEWETGGETYHAVYSKDLSFYTMKTVQECQARIEALEAALAAL